MLVLVKNVNIANADRAVSGITQTECSLWDIAGDRNLAYNIRNIDSSSNRPGRYFRLWAKYGIAPVLFG